MLIKICAKINKNSYVSIINPFSMKEEGGHIPKNKNVIDPKVFEKVLNIDVSAIEYFQQL
jgi:hypothetical protein